MFPDHRQQLADMFVRQGQRVGFTEEQRPPGARRFAVVGNDRPHVFLKGRRVAGAKLHVLVKLAKRAAVVGTPLGALQDQGIVLVRRQHGHVAVDRPEAGSLSLRRRGIERRRALEHRLQHPPGLGGVRLGKLDGRLPFGEGRSDRGRSDPGAVDHAVCLVSTEHRAFQAAALVAGSFAAVQYLVRQSPPPIPVRLGNLDQA